jgi:single-stranded-DNA-specific exonuclease
MPDIVRRQPPGHQLEQLADVHPLLQRIFASRGITDAAQTRLSLEDLLPPTDFLGLREAACLLADALAAQLSILVVGDFDADGATSTAVALTALRSMGAQQVDFLVPNRFDYGYGLTPEIVDLAARGAPDLIVTVDNGISSIEGVARAKVLGIKTLITDHHLAGSVLPAADVIVNPNQPGCGFPGKNLAGVGVIFYVMSALRSELRQRGWFKQHGLPEPRLADLLDLVALGTVADVVPLDYNNRVLVQQGLLRIRAGRARPGIRALLSIAGRQENRLVASDLGFAVAPRLNAAGRMDDMTVGINCLLADNDADAHGLAAQLDTLNRDRQSIEREMQAEALEILEQFFAARDGELPASFCLFDGSWHQGVVGILASRIKDRLHRPTIAFARGDEGMLKGSARSIPGLHIRDALERVATQHPGLVEKFGGHAMAAGLSLEESALPAFTAAFEAQVARFLEKVDLQARIDSDGELAREEMELELANALRYAGPWGQHFPEPLFDGIFGIVQQRLVGERHLKLVLSHPTDGSLFDAIAFGVDLEVWPAPEIERARVAYRLDCNYFRGEERLQLMIEHIEPCK